MNPDEEVRACRHFGSGTGTGTGVKLAFERKGRRSSGKFVSLFQDLMALSESM